MSQPREKKLDDTLAQPTTGFQGFIQIC